MITREEKVAFILKIVESGASGKDIEPTKKGSTVSKLKKNPGAKITEKKLDEMYENAKRLKSGKAPEHKRKAPEYKRKNVRKEKAIKIEKGGLDSIVEQISKQQSRILELERENQSLKDYVSQIERKIDDLISTKISTIESKLSFVDNNVENKSSTVDKIVDKSLYGFTLGQRTTSGKKKYWYAGKRIGGKMYWIYIGKNKDTAKEKVEAWIAEHPEQIKL